MKPHQLVTPESRFFIKSTIRSFVLGHPQLGFNEPGPETQVQTNIENVTLVLRDQHGIGLIAVCINFMFCVAESVKS